MSEVKDNLRSVQRDVRSVGWENWLRDDGEEKV